MKRKRGAAAQEQIPPAEVVVGARVDTSSLYPDAPTAVVADVTKRGAWCTLFYASDNTKETREISWVSANLVVYPPEDGYGAVMCGSGNGASECWLVREGGTLIVYNMSRAVLGNDLDDWILTCAAANPGFWLPIEPRSHAL